MNTINILLIEELPEQNGYYVCLLYCKNGALYCGWTTNIRKRILCHQSGKGAKYTKANPPIGVYYYEQLLDSTSARKREYAIKQMSHQEKLELIYKK